LRPRRNKRTPSSSHQIVALALKKRSYNHGTLEKRNEMMMRDVRATLRSATVCGKEATEWVFQQLANLPEVVEPGWPTPPMQKMRRRNRRGR
jgi:hypothetical protein